MRSALVINHVAFEDLGSLEPGLVQSGCKIEVIDAATADLLAIDAVNPDLMVVLGGPVGVYEHEAYPFLKVEIELLRSRLAAKRPTLGICLGAQLMAAALGADVYPGTNGRELGWAPVRAASGQGVPPWFDAFLTRKVRVLHWHGDTFDLPAGSTWLAGTDCYPNQAFAMENHALALQFHLEVTVQGLERWYVGHASELGQAGKKVVQLREESRIFGPALETAARELWRQWLEQVFYPSIVSPAAARAVRTQRGDSKGAQVHKKKAS